MQNKQHHDSYDLLFRDTSDVIQLAVSAWIWAVASAMISRILLEKEQSNLELRRMNEHLMMINTLNHQLRFMSDEYEAKRIIERAIVSWFSRESWVSITFDTESALFQAYQAEVDSLHAHVLYHPIQTGKIEMIRSLDVEAGQFFFPIIVLDEVAWVISLQQKELAFLPDHQNLLTNLASQIEGNLGNIRFKNRLREQALNDPLTGLHNRRYMETILEKEFNRSLRDGSLFSVVMIDLDFFKNINDMYGHESGDMVLQEISLMLKKQFFRKSDHVCRFWGEELLVFMSNCSFEEAMKRAEAFRSKVEHHDFPISSSFIRVTASIGVASYHPHDSSPNTIIKRADDALYIAKNHGRNQVNGTSEIVVSLDEGE